MMTTFKIEYLLFWVVIKKTKAEVLNIFLKIDGIESNFEVYILSFLFSELTNFYDCN